MSTLRAGYGSKHPSRATSATNARLTLAVAEKELMENILSWRFLIALVLGTLILVTSVMALGAAYAEDYAAYQRKTSDLAAREETSSVTQLQLMPVLEKPNPLGIFVGGPGDALRRDEPTTAGGVFGVIALPIGGATSSASAEDVDSGSQSPTNTRFAPLDLGFVAVVVMTFMAVIFSFDAMSGERERGTLKLMLANPVPKDVVLLGKYLGGMASILIPFGVSVLVGLVVLQFRGIALSGDEWTRLGLIVAFFVPLVSAFYLLGLAVSSIVRRSGTSLIALSLAWLVLVFGAGNVAAVAAKETSDAPTPDELADAFAQIDDRASAELEGIGAEIQSLQRKRFENNNTLSAEDQARFQALVAEQASVADEAATARVALVQDARRKLDNDLRRAESFAAASPAEAFRGIATALAHADYWSYKDAAEAAEEYRSEVTRAQQEWFGENARFSRVSPGGGNGTFTIGPGGFRPQVAGSTFEPPLFHYEAQSVSEQLSSSGGVRDLLMLLAYNVLGFAGAYLAFVRYDVR